MQAKLAFLLAVCAASFFIGLGADGITRSQEGRVLETAREMRDSGDYLLPRLIGQPRFEKPPLLYWITAAGYALTGRVNELAGRVPVAIFGIACVLALFALGRRHLGERAGFFAALALATGPLFVQHARLAETDVPQAFFVTLAVLAFLGERPLLAWLIMAVGFLNKGPGTLVIPLVTLAAWRVWSREPRVLLRDCHWWFVLVSLALALSWHFAVLWTQHESLGVFTTELGRLALKADERHDEGYLYYFREILNFAPWIIVAVAGIPFAFRQLRRPTGDGARGLRFALAWFLITFLILMATRNKQRHYLVVLLPSCALLAGWALDRLAAWRAWIAPAIVAAAIALAAGNIWKCAVRDPQRSEDVVMRDFVRRVAASLRPDDEFIFLDSTAYGRNRIALAFYTQRVFSTVTERALRERLAANTPLAVVTTAGPLPVPLKQLERAKVGRLTWTFWKNR
ncbi:MAG: glycosyltransferase family 39 protein [Verrucomicrobia bacterium]|nr:glycosyltransferase family 39 protein [Verrucomicrobiota bacterium]